MQPERDGHDGRRRRNWFTSTPDGMMAADSLQQVEVATKDYLRDYLDDQMPPLPRIESLTESKGCTFPITSRDGKMTGAVCTAAAGPHALMDLPDESEVTAPAPAAGVAGRLPEFAPDSSGHPARLIDEQPHVLRRIFPGHSPVSYLLSPSSLLTRRAEDWRHLRAQLKLKLGVRGALLMVSCRQSEGRSIAALNLSIAFAQEYGRVVYVEADFRRPSLHTFFELPQRRGLAQLLQQGDPIDDRIGEELVPTNIPGLFLLPAGVRMGTPELLDSPRLEAVLAQLKAEADWVIVDSAPLLTYADAIALAKLVDGVVVVALEGRSRADELARLLERLESAGATIAAAVYIRRS